MDAIYRLISFHSVWDNIACTHDSTDMHARVQPCVLSPFSEVWLLIAKVTLRNGRRGDVLQLKVSFQRGFGEGFLLEEFALQREGSGGVKTAPATKVPATCLDCFAPISLVSLSLFVALVRAQRASTC